MTVCAPRPRVDPVRETITQVTSALEEVPGLPDERVNPNAEAIAQSGGTAVIEAVDDSELIAVRPPSGQDAAMRF
ncbi:MAG: hypothetical protein WCA29_07605 [Jiangellales bacterium]